jgi:hypothetical protein
MTLPAPKYYWPFDETSGFTASDIEQQAAITLDRASWTAGLINNGLRFGRNGGASIGSTTLADLPAPWSAGFWVKREDDTTASTLFSKGDKRNLLVRLEQWTGGTVGSTAGLSFVDNNGVFNDHSFQYTVEKGEWIYLTLVASANGTALYANGQAKGVSLPVSQPLPLAFIGSFGDYSEICGAVIDELKLFDVALDAAQVAALYSSSQPGEKLAVTLNGAPAENGGSKDLGQIGIGQSGSVQFMITNSVGGDVTFTTSGADVSIKSALRTLADKPVGPSTLASSYVVALTPKVSGPLSAKLMIKNDMDAFPPFSYTVLANAVTTPVTNPPGPPAKPLPGVVSLIIGDKVVTNGGSFNVNAVNLQDVPQVFTATLYNDTINYVTITGNGASMTPPDAGFNVVTQTTTAVSLARGKSQSLTFNFSPTSSGSKNAVLTIGLTGGVFTVNLTGAANPYTIGKQQLVAANDVSRAVVMHDGSVMLQNGSANWVTLRLPGGRKIAAIDMLAVNYSYGMLAQTDTNELWANAGDANWVKVSDGVLLFSCARKAIVYSKDWLLHNNGMITVQSDGRIFAPGNAPQLGTADGTGYVADLPFGKITQIQYSEGNFTAALDTDGKVYCWGQNNLGQCAASASVSLNRPGRVYDLPPIAHLATSRYDGRPYSLAVDKDGFVWGWGQDSGALSGSAAQATATAGKIIAKPRKLDNLENMAYVFIGRTIGQAFGIDKAGNVWSWGTNSPLSGSGFGCVGRPDMPLNAYAAPGIVWAVQADGIKALCVACNTQGVLILTEEMLWAYTSFGYPWTAVGTPQRINQTSDNSLV